MSIPKEYRLYRVCFWLCHGFILCYRAVTSRHFRIIVTFQPLCCYLLHTNLYFAFVSLAGWDTSISIVLAIISLLFVSILITPWIIVCIIKSISILLLAHICVWRELHFINVLMDHLAKCRSASVSVVCLLQGFYSSISEDVFSRCILCKCKKRLLLSNMLRFGAWASPPCYHLRVSQLTIRFVHSDYSFVVRLRSECLTRCRSVVPLFSCSIARSFILY